MATRRNYVTDQIDRTDAARRNQAIDPEDKARMKTLKEETARRDRALDQPDAGAGRGGQGGPTAKEMSDYERKQNRGIYTAEMGAPPTDPEMAKKHGGMIKKMANGGSASSRADGCCTKGKTRGKMV
jgi:hypothetical protein